MMHARPGAAIVSALLMVALVASLASTALWQGWRSAQGESAMRQQAQARWLLGGALDWALVLLAHDGQDSGAVDHLGEAWARPQDHLPIDRFLTGALASARPAAQLEMPTESGPWLSLQLIDAQGRLNLLNLLEGAAISEPWLEVFARLFDQLGLPQQELETLTRGLLQASAGTSQGAGPNAPLMPQRPDDLSWLGLTPSTVAALQPHLSVLPGRMPVNLNTAGAQVLQAVLGLPAAQVQQLLERRKAQPLVSLDGSNIGPQPGASRVGLSSQFFEAHLLVELGPQWRLSERALLQRQGSTVRVLWRQ